MIAIFPLYLSKLFMVAVGFDDKKQVINYHHFYLFFVQLGNELGYQIR